LILRGLLFWQTNFYDFCPTFNNLKNISVYQNLTQRYKFRFHA